MSRTQQDSVIDDDEETCPLCIEEFDLGDKNFRPCPCGYQICQFCFNSLKNTYDKSTCPNCRRPYDEKTIQYKIPTAEDIKQDLLNKNRKQIAAKRKETEKREVETSSRRNLAGVRVKQQNLVYVIGLVPTLKDEQQLLQTLRGDSYFGQYGDIEKIVVSKAKPGAANQGIGVYVTFARKEDAALCISMVDGSLNGDRVLRAQYGTTKYCSAYLRGELCNNRNCTFLHESGEDGQGSSLQNEPSITTKRPTAATLPSYSQPAVRQASTANIAGPSTSQHVRPQNSRDDSDGRKGSGDASALPTSASWATKDAQQAMRVRRESQTNSRSSLSPQVTNATIAQPEGKRKETATPPVAQSAKPAVPPSHAATSQASSGKSSPKPIVTKKSAFDDLVASVNSPDFRFIFDDTTFTKDELAAIYRLPTLIDPFGGAKRRLLREKEASERAKLEAEAQDKLQATATSTIDAIEDETLASGSFQLGGEPEESSRPIRRSDTQSAIGRPNSNQLQANNAINDQFANLNIDGRSLTPHQRQQLALLSSANVSQAPGLNQQTQTGFSGGGFDTSDQRSNLFANQHIPYDSTSGHARQSSRYSFANENAKQATNVRYGQQQNASSQQQHYYSSGVQGPPPGLKASGTPPISGGGMFAQGHGFTSNMNTAFANKDGNADMFLRGRSGTGSGPDASKRESLPYNANSHRSPPLSPAPSLLNSLYGPMSGAYQDPGLVKQKKKGKKQRQADTSSAGGGVVDLADPSILQARLHQSGAGTGQGMFGGQSQDDEEFPPLGPPRTSQHTPQVSRFFPTQTSADLASRSGTPKVPPGLSLPHGHPSPAFSTEEDGRSKAPAQPQPPAVVIPALPLIPIEQRSPTSARPVSRAERKTPVKALPPSENDSTSLEQATPRRRADTDRLTSSLPTATADDERAFETETSEKAKGKDKEVVKTPTQAADPQKIDLSAIKRSSTSFTDQDAPKSSAIDPPPLVATPLSMSRPGTPGTGISKASDPASVSRPRTLRLTTTSTTPKMTDIPPVSATTEKSSGLPAIVALRDHSRQPSVSSLSRSRPSSPAISEMATSSINMSRANSPPPSVVGSAPERTKTKNQLKKERKAKAKEALDEGLGTTATSQKAALVPTPPAEDIGPIMSRQKKKKRPQESATTTTSTRTKRESSIAAELSEQNDDSEDAARVSQAKTVKQDMSKTKEEPKPAVSKPTIEESAALPVSTTQDKAKSVSPEPETTRPYVPTLGDFFADLKAHAASAPGQDATTLIPDLLEQYISDAPAMIARMFQSGELDPNSALFNPPSLNSYRLQPNATTPSATTNKGVSDSQPSSKKSAAYELTFGPQGSFSGQYAPAYPFGTITLTNSDRKALLNGQPIRVNDPDRANDLQHRVMITPRGTVYRHMSAEEEEKVLELESRMDESSLAGLYGPDNIDSDIPDEYGPEYGDYENLKGGVEELIHQPARHGIVWVSTGSSSTHRTQGRRKADQPARPAVRTYPGDDDASSPVETGNEDPSTVDEDEEDRVEYAEPSDEDEDSDTSDLHLSSTRDILSQQSPTYAAMNARFGGPDFFATDYSDFASSRAPTAGEVNPNATAARGNNTEAARLRTMDVATLIQRINSTKAEMEQLRKELEGQEKKTVRRGRDVVKWRDGIIAAAGGVRK